MRQLALFAEPILANQKLPTNLTTSRYPVHRWFNFIAGFSPEFVTNCIQGDELGHGSVLIDPFAGLCTALVQASFEGIDSIGFESHPFFFDISMAKIHPPASSASVNRIECSIGELQPFNGELASIWSADAVAFLIKLIPERDLRILGSALLLEAELPTADQPLYRLIISRVLEHASGSATDGVYKAPTTFKKAVPFEIATARVCAEIRHDTAIVSNFWRGEATLFKGSSEEMSAVRDESCSVCVTSPPYLNNFDFAEMTRMELYFWRYAKNWKDITEKVRRHLVVNTTTAPIDMRREQAMFAERLPATFQEAVQPIVTELRTARQNRSGKKPYDSLVVPYFAQMYSVFRELKRVLRSGASFHLVIADAALYGVHVKTHMMLAQLLHECGFGEIGIDRLRTRGDRWVLQKRQGASEPLGEFHLHARRP